MVTENNSQINYFTGGMNSDSGIEDIKENQYIEARNIRITKYNNDRTTRSTNLQDQIRPIEGVLEQAYIHIGDEDRIIAQGSIKEYGIVITQTTDPSGQYGPWSVYRFKVSDGYSRKRITLKEDPIFGPTNTYDQPFNRKPTIHFRYEDKDNIKLYILDNEHPIMVLNIAPSNDEYNRSLKGDIDKIMSYPKITFNIPEFQEYIAGKLKPAIVSYSYQLYNKHGISTDVSPACKFIPIGNYKDNERRDINGTKGSLQDKETNIGCSIRIKISGEESYLDKIRVYRITYQQNGQLPTVDIIYQGDYLNDRGYDYYFYLNDVGQDPLQSITIEEYNSMSGVHIIPKAIESKNDYMFAANVTDQQTALVDFVKDYDTRAFRFSPKGECNLYSATSDSRSTITDPSQANNFYGSSAFRDCYNPNNNINNPISNDELYDLQGYYGGSGVNISWRFVITQNVEDANPAGNYRDIGTQSNYIKKQNLNTDQDDINKALCCTKSYFVKRGGTLEYIDGLHPNNIKGYWKNPYIIKSLRRDELYRYGIIFYDKYGKASPVKWIADIRTPSIYDKGFETFASHSNVGGPIYDLATRPLGVAFSVRNLPSLCTAYEIVRCTRTANDIATVSQGVISRPVISYYRLGDEAVRRNIYNPTGFLTTADLCEGRDALSPFCGKQKKDYNCMTNIFNYNTFQFVSPEVCYQSESIQQILKDKQYKLQMLTYLFGTRGDIAYKDTMFDDKFFRGGDNESYSTNNSPVTFINPGISNTSVEIVNGSCSGGMYIFENTVDGKTISSKLYNENTVIHLDSRYQRDYFLKLTPLYYTTQITGGLLYGFSYGKWSTARPKQLASNIYSSESPFASDNRNTDKNRSFDIYDNFDQAEATSFSYIKLYEQSINALQKTSYWSDRPVFAKGERLLPSSTHADIKIKDLQIAENIAWNKAWGESKDKDGKITGYNADYQNTLSSVGDSMYCNFVSGGFYGSSTYDLEGAFDRKTPWTSGPSTRFSAIMGLGGTTALLYLDNDSISQFGDSGLYSLPSTTIGACTYKTFDQSLNSTESSASATWNANGSRPIVKDSILGTYLCNIRKEVVPYGGYDFATRNLNAYYSDGDYFLNDGKEWNCVFNGDVYIGAFEYTSMHKYWQVFNDNNLYPNTHCIMYSIPVETSINLNFTQGYQFSKDAEEGQASFIQEEPSTVIEQYVQKQPQYVYNTAYSAENRARVQTALDQTNIEDYNKNIEYRCYYSNLKTNNEVIDSWTKYQSSNFLDADSNKGPIVNLRSFKNYLVFWQQFATGLFSVNERALTTDDNTGSSIILGTGGVLSRYDYIDDTSGMDQYSYCDTQSATSLYWFDKQNNEIKCFSGGSDVMQLSKSLLVNNLMNNYKSYINELNRLMFYDKENSEIVSQVLLYSADNMSIAYNEQAKVFTSLYTIPFEGVSHFDGATVLGHVSDYYIDGVFGRFLNLGLWNSPYPDYPSNWDSEVRDAHISTYIKYAVNKQPYTTKVFDNQEIVTPNKVDNIGIEKLKDKQTLDVDTKSYYSNNHNYTWQTDINSSKGNLKDQVTLREGNYRFSIPRTEGEFGNRIRGKYMICSIEDKYPSNDAAIKYIITKFRTSWS